MSIQEDIDYQFRLFYAVQQKEKRVTLFNNFVRTGYKLLDKVQPIETILDVGCGFNLFKEHRPNTLIGIDPVTEEADYQCTIENFVTDQTFDVAFCLGSLQFGNLDHITLQIQKISSLLKPTGRIYWRCNPASNFTWHYRWTLQDHKSLSNTLGFNLIDFNIEYEDRNLGSQIDQNNPYWFYAEWQKREVV